MSNLKWLLLRCLGRFSFLYVALAITILCLVVFSVYVYLPTVQKVDELKRLGSVDGLATQTHSAATTYHTERAFLASLPRIVDLPSQLSIFHQLAQENGIAFSQVQYSAQTMIHTQVTVYDIVFSVQNDYQSVKRFISEVLNNLPNIALKQVRFTRDIERSGVMETELQFSLFVRNHE